MIKNKYFYFLLFVSVVLISFEPSCLVNWGVEYLLSFVPSAFNGNLKSDVRLVLAPVEYDLNI